VIRNASSGLAATVDAVYRHDGLPPVTQHETPGNGLQARFSTEFVALAFAPEAAVADMVAAATPLT
jgi:hypothetical protein